jgi:hypothetical protein
MAGHLFPSEDPGDTGRPTDGAGRPAAVRLSVCHWTSPKAMALHTSSESFSLGRSYDIHPIPEGKDFNRYFLTLFEFRVRGAEFPQESQWRQFGFPQMAQFAT